VKWRALTVREPWCTLIAWGAKRIETRTWRTRYRGPLLLCAGKTVEEDLVATLVEAEQLPYPVMPGHALATANLVACRQGRAADQRLAMCTATDLWAWVLEDVVPCRPFKVRGQPGLFDIDCDPVPVARPARRPRRALAGQMELL